MSTTSRREASASSDRMGTDRTGNRRTAPVDFTRPAPLGPDETRAVRSVHDDPAYAEIRAELAAELDRQQAAIGDLPRHRRPPAG